ncbi:hypothetical protein HDU78_010454 [Chytriomyces hyalinus]|nr:hypothetical protein HDU78_010454 [Chytriomyces hyalinus]
MQSLHSHAGYGVEVALSENVGSSLNPDTKFDTDFFKLGKTMQDIYLSLARSLMANLQLSAKFVNAMDSFRIRGFRTSGFAVTTSLLIHAGGGLLMRNILDEVLVPVAFKDLREYYKVAWAMLKMKGIISKTINHSAQIKSDMAIEKREGVVTGKRLWFKCPKKVTAAKK